MATGPPARPTPAAPRAPGARPTGLKPLAVLGVTVLVVACLYVAQAVVMPIALAVLFTFLLSPVVGFLQRHGVHRVVAVLAVVVLVFAVLAGVAWIMVAQVSSLGAELPLYKDNIREKIADVHLLGRGGPIERVQETVSQAAGEVKEQVEAETGTKPKADPPTPVVVTRDESGAVWTLPATLNPWLQPLGSAGLVVVLVPFMLLSRQELRNRVIRLIGFGRLATTTKALDEAGARVSRYLLSQSFINATFAVMVSLGLFLLGVPYALLLGFLAGLLRFIPYVGPWIGALMPIALSMAIFPGWTKPLLVVGLFLVLELFTNMVLETLLYARSAGVWEVGLLVAVAFWTWLWGPVGLMLATPLTVCFVVFAKHIPELEFLHVLMGDERVIDTPVAYYQRLLAMDQDEAGEIVDEFVRRRPPESVHDEVLIPALVLARGDREWGRITEDQHRFVLRATREILDDLASPAAAAAGNGGPVLPRIRVVAAPARDETDEVALLMLRHLLDPRRVELEVAAAGMLWSEIIPRAADERCGMVVIAALPPGGVAQARYLCKRFRARFPRVRILVGRWCRDEDLDALQGPLRAAGADEVAVTLPATRDQVLQLSQVRAEPVPGHVA